MEILYQVVVLSNSWIWCYQSIYFSNITTVEVCQVVDQAKIALTLVQNRICKNEVIDLKNTQNFKKITM